MLDVHILLCDRRPAEWTAQCVLSVVKAADWASFPVAVHVLPWIPGHVGRARAAGYAMGKHPYVTYVDDDDYLMPVAFRAYHQAMRNGSPAIFSSEWTSQNDKITPGLSRHHLCVYRRDVLIDHTQWPVCGDAAQVTHAARLDGVVDLQHRPYVHRVYLRSGGALLRAQHPGELQRALS